MELADLRSKPKKKAKKKKSKANIKKDDSDDEETKRLSDELMLYGQNEQDEAEMYAGSRSDEKPRHRGHQQPQNVDEHETAQEIEAALQEMKYDEDDDEDESSQLRQYF